MSARAGEVTPPGGSKAPVLAPGQTYASATDRISSAILDGPPRGFWLLFGLFFVLMLVFLYAVLAVLLVGVGILGINIPVAWGFPIINVVWWIGIGHAGTLISAVLLLMRQDWRTSINRFAEAMTIFAASIAAFHPILHLGRPWFFYWLLPYPNNMELWPQWRSALVWDFFAIGTYLVLSLLFWYMGLIPDLATLRDRARSRLKQLGYGLAALGWRGSARHWANMERTYLIMAALATPLVVSVHSVVSLDFAIALIPGYHSTMFPPYFVAGALYSGFAMVVTILVPLRAAFGLQAYITQRHIDNAGKVMLATGSVVAYGYLMEFFLAWYSGSEYHSYVAVNRALGPYAPAFWVMILCNVGVLQSLWFRAVRHRPWLFWVVSILINVGMWAERYVIVITSTHRDYLPSSWNTVAPTTYDWMLLAGSLGLFFSLMFLFFRILPAISIFEVRELIHQKGGGAGGEDSDG